VWLKVLRVTGGQDAHLAQVLRDKQKIFITNETSRSSLAALGLWDSRTELIQYAGGGRKRGVYAPFPPLKVSPRGSLPQQGRFGSTYMKEDGGCWPRGVRSFFAGRRG
jgi:hypothetical protein